ncbi:class I SAM-dependent methyltransferase [Agrobacterium larrymoorei]|uniref:class I SAM-dependent methyltransferase n=1 Tax=Agrobacterium larrymoorei TaxID=160699 RepID=UPI0015733405
MSQLKNILFDGESLITPEAISEEIFAKRDARFHEQRSLGQAELVLILNLAQQQFLRGNSPAEIIHAVAKRLHDLRKKYYSSVWGELIPIAQHHPVAEYLLQDPFSNWSFVKPRGYSGDAQLLDFIYGHESISAKVTAASPLGAALYECTRNSLSSAAVRERRDILTRYVDHFAAQNGPGTEILTIAAGHLREANRSEALANGQVKRWVALDQDPMSIGAIARDFGGTAVEAVDGSVRGLLGRKHELGQFDFVYAAGLYDYLADKVAITLTQRCLDMLKPGGTFLFANFAEGIDDDGFMETFMNWALLLRSEVDMWNIINASTGNDGFEAEVFLGENRNIVYGVIRKLS